MFRRLFAAFFALLLVSLAIAAVLSARSTRERVLGVLLPVPVGAQDDRPARVVAIELGDDVLEDPRPELPRGRAVVRAAQPRLGSVTAEQDRLPQLDPPADGAAPARRWPQASRCATRIQVFIGVGLRLDR